MKREVKVIRVKVQEHPDVDRYFDPKATQEQKDEVMDHIVQCRRCSIIWAREMRIGPCPSEEELREAVNSEGVKNLRSRLKKCNNDPNAIQKIVDSLETPLMEKLRPHIQKCPSCEAAIGLTLFEE